MLKRPPMRLGELLSTTTGGSTRPTRAFGSSPPVQQSCFGRSFSSAVHGLLGRLGFTASSSVPWSGWPWQVGTWACMCMERASLSSLRQSGLSPSAFCCGAFRRSAELASCNQRCNPVSGSYRGTLGGSGEIVGEWIEGSKRTPVTFKRASSETKAP